MELRLMCPMLGLYRPFFLLCGPGHERIALLYFSCRKCINLLLRVMIFMASSCKLAVQRFMLLQERSEWPS
jgi:hypothetical protein